MEDIRFSAQNECRINNVSYISVVRKKGFSFEFKRGKSTLTFVFIKMGEMEFRFQDEKIFLSKGDTLFIPQNMPYIVTYLEDYTNATSITFDFAANTPIPCLLKPLVKKSSSFQSIFKSVTSLNMRNTTFLLAKAYELIYLMQTHTSDIPKKYLKILPALNELRNEYSQNKPILYYASLCKMSESNFRKLFKEHTGKTPIEYRNELRIFEAKKLIDSGEYNVQEAAYTVGFNNMPFFYNVLRKYSQK